jgi:hypothetical protein
MNTRRPDQKLSYDEPRYEGDEGAYRTLDELERTYCLELAQALRSYELDKRNILKFGKRFPNHRLLR